MDGLGGGDIAEISVRSGQRLTRGTAFLVGSGLLLTTAALIDAETPVDSITAQPASAADPVPAKLLFRDSAAGIAIIEMAPTEADGTYDQVAGTLLSLALAFGQRHATTGGDGDLATTIGLYRQAIPRMAADDPRRVPAMSNLAAALRNRYERDAEAADLEEAVGLLVEALAATPGDRPERPVMLSNLAAALRARSKRTGSQADLDESVGLLREAPRRNPRRPGRTAGDALQPRRGPADAIRAHLEHRRPRRISEAPAGGFGADTGTPYPARADRGSPPPGPRSCASPRGDLKCRIRSRSTS